MLRRSVLVVVMAATAVCAGPQDEVARWERQARNVTIIRDDWGIAHVYGKSDADTVFGAMYAQAEDDFNRIETNYLNAMGRLAEAEGESKVYQDLRMRLFINSGDLKKQYASSPPWLQKLMIAFADGLNYFLVKNPETKPRVIHRFEPWMALSFTEGSIGGDIESISVESLKAFYGKRQLSQSAGPALQQVEPSGSNGIAIAPALTKNGRALLLINPHTSFFFRSELQMVSNEGLRAYGASTWGQFFIYQGFNDRAGWMHTSSNIDVIDEYLETVTRRGERFLYKFGDGDRPVTATPITISYRTSNGGTAEKVITTYRTHHGPIVGESEGKWIAVRLMQEPIKALMQSYLRTKARNYNQFRQTMELMANSSNNTVYADADGTIAYFHGNFVPVRDTRFDWTKPVDGSNPATEWNGLHRLTEIPQLLNPPSGWLYNANDWPWAAAGPGSLKQAQYPTYMESGTETARGRHAVLVLQGKKDFTLSSLNAAAYDTYLPWFEQPLPALLRAWDALPSADALKSKLSAQMTLLRGWDMRWSAASVPTALGVFWHDQLWRQFNSAAQRAGVALDTYVGKEATGEQLLQAFSAATDRLIADFGRWQIPWGEINRFQRLTGDIVQTFDDTGPSVPVGFTSGNLGSLASFGARPYPGTKKWYGTSGNSFVAVVEFGKRVQARALTAGGESGRPESRHFNDQADRYSAGNLREVYFYRSQLKGHTEREYHPGR